MKARNLYLLLAALAIAGAGLITLATRKTVTLVDGEQRRTLKTFAFSTGQLLAEQGLPIGPGDEILPGLDARLQDGATVRVQRAAQISILADRKIIPLLTTERVPANLMANARITLSPGDLILLDGRPVLPGEPLDVDGAAVLSLKRAVKVVLDDGSQVRTLFSTAATLGRALWEAGILLEEADRLDPPSSTSLAGAGPDGLQAVLKRARDLTIQTAEAEVKVSSSAETVGEALALSGMALEGLDYSLPAEDQPLPDDGIVRVVRVSESVLVEQTPLPFETEYQPVTDLEIDQQQIVQTGEYGLTARRVRVLYEDGVEITRTLEAEWVARPPQNRVVGYGTQIVMHTLETPEGTIQYWRALQMWATSYHPSTTGNTTASGLPLKKGVAAIDRRYIPFYTRMYIPGYGEAVAADIGGGVIGRWIDLGYSDSDYESWHQWVTVYFLWPPPENIVWIIP